MTVTLVLGCATCRGFSSSDPLFLSWTVAILRFQRSSDCGFPVHWGLLAVGDRKAALGSVRSADSAAGCRTVGDVVLAVAASSPFRRRHGLTTQSAESCNYLIQQRKFRKVPQLCTSLPTPKLPAGQCKLGCEPARLSPSLQNQITLLFDQDACVPRERNFQE